MSQTYFYDRLPPSSVRCDERDHGGCDGLVGVRGLDGLEWKRCSCWCHAPAASKAHKRMVAANARFKDAVR